jgi:hypothetical protein
VSYPTCHDPAMSTTTSTGGTERNRTKAHRGFFPLVVGGHVDVRRAGAVAFVAGNDINLKEGGGSALLAGNRITIERGGGNLLASGSGISIEQGGAVIALAPEIKLSKAYVGLAMGRSVEIAGDSRLIMGGREAAIAGASLAVTTLLLRWLIGLLTRR